MRKAYIYYNNILAGIDSEYTFQYNKKYINLYPTQFITFTMPVKDKVYREKRVHSTLGYKTIKEFEVEMYNQNVAA